MLLQMLAAICVVPGLFNTQQLQAAADVTTPAGRVAGLELDVLGTTVHAFLGIPFAQPPVGERRFKLAEPMEPWDGIYNATRIPYACSQDREVVNDQSDLWGLNAPKSEDCLYLNVWQPTPAPTGAAVLVWIYGGSFEWGSSSLPTYDGRYLAATEGVLVVSFNYRVSALGFLYTGTPDAPGNVGLTDQVLALTWVQDNIAAFGGDPARVTLFGESAGGVSIGYHLISPGSRDLFSRAILQSGTALNPWGYNSEAVAYEKTVAFANHLGCPTEQGSTGMLACLRDKDAQQLVDTSAVGYATILPVVDGSFLPESPPVAYQNGAFKKADLLLGSNEDEGVYFLISNQYPGFSNDTESLITKDQFLQCIRYAIPVLNEFGVDAVAFQYTDWERLDQDTMYRDAMDDLYGGYIFVCPDVNTGRAHLRNGATSYMYRFSHRPSASPYPAWVGAIHGEEVPFVFGLPLDPVYGFTQEEKQLARRMMRHWANFARTGDPNNNNESGWSAFNTTHGGYMVLDASQPRMLTGPSTRNCAFLDNYLKPLSNKTDALMNDVPCASASGVPFHTRPGIVGSNLTACVLVILLVIQSTLVFEFLQL
ncbi:cholinesterase 2-like [Branchiostoma floridae]|uniref:Carboxylic ester hydrolase n=1 Tax=Branchiostoma floridae TaxID=7739 RepID=A0A9J7N2U9_BRAFL|nr:cholinesterase 2-like [Branchiostoma floridae]